MYRNKYSKKRKYLNHNLSARFSAKLRKNLLRISTPGSTTGLDLAGKENYCLHIFMYRTILHYLGRHFKAAPL